ncbi:MAG: hypothetical protein IKO65_04715 [Victivallales bacterium]|nr:hypothetical protein [Victivallales bacterium]
MADTIASVAVTNNAGVDVFKTRWGSTVYDYQLNGVSTDFQDLMVAISEHRATAVEGEVAPLSTRMRKRNKDLELLGSLLAIFSQTQSKYAHDADGGAQASVSGVTSEMVPLACEAYRRKGGTPSTNLSWWNEPWSKSSVDGMVSVLKSMIDERNNAAQTDMTRLQSLVDRRDESFTTATTLMTNVSETRDNAIRNM